ncbi:MAG: sugar ABC transporter permease [Oscillospiraceae bacterium]|jgi:putative aldouronate transport system permease protein|nr:sugar ABC transporter permease [Oscillospiraceae bacterium]
MSAAPHSGFAAFKQSLRKNWSLYLLALPVLIYFAVFLYWPMYGIIIAFKDFSPGKGILGSPWAQVKGEINLFKHFSNFFTSVHFTRTIRNTLGISFYSLAINWPLPIAFAILMNEIRSMKLKKTVQTVTYLPHFISTVVMCGILWIFLRNETGMINYMLKAVGIGNFNFLNEPQYFKHVYVWSGVWQNTGWNTIIYMSTLSGMDTQMYEAANIDGANKWQQIWYITLPCLMPTAVMLLILDCGSIMSVGFEKIFLLQTDLTFETSDVISTLVYRKGLEEANYSFSAAVGLFNSVINCFLLITVNQISKKLGDVSMF